MQVTPYHEKIFKRKIFTENLNHVITIPSLDESRSHAPDKSGRIRLARAKLKGKGSKAGIVRYS